jgi:hypothetical protein
VRSPPSSGDIVVFGSTYWDTPPLTEHHLARALSERARTLFVEKPKSLAHPLRDGRLRRVVPEVASLARRRLRRDDRLDVLRVLSLPPARSVRARKASEPWERVQVRRATARLRLRPRLVLAARPIPESLLPSPRPFVVALVKDWLQAGSHLTGLDVDDLRARELAFWRGADLVCSVSLRLQDRLAEDGIASVLLRHGYDHSRPAAASADVPVPELRDLPRPILGSVGRLDGRLAFSDLETLAQTYAHGSVVLVGPVSNLMPTERFERLLSHPNVHRFDSVAGEQLDAWLRSMDCCLIPYMDDHWQQFSSPLKVWDYLSAGRPVAATGAPALGDFPDGLIDYAARSSALPALVGRALAENHPAAADARRAYVLQNTWEQRATQLLAYVAADRGGETNAVKRSASSS